MNKPHRHRRGSGRNAAKNRAPAAKSAAKGGAPRGARSANPPKTRHFYDVRQYALLTDSAGNLLILQLPKDYDTTSANTWTLPGGKLEPADEPGAGLLREITEETGLPATLVGPCAVGRWTSRNSKKLAIFYRATTPGIKPNTKLSAEHQRAIWVNAQEIAADVTSFPFHRPEMQQIILQQLKA